MLRHLSTGMAAFMAAGFLNIQPANAQDTWEWPEKRQNLQILPKDLPGSDLRNYMISFVNGLGVRCSHCHVGEEGQPRSTYDFPSDANPNKGKARVMLTMVDDINDHLKNIEPRGDERVDVWCQTCHRGRPRPMRLSHELGETYRLNGIESALEHYAFLKDNFYGKGAYNFGPSALNGLGYTALRAEDIQGAIRLFKMNTAEYPENANSWDSLGEAYMKAGNRSAAIRNYKKSLALNPDNQNAKDMLEELGAKN